MYPYHNKIKQRIRNGELLGFEFVEKYKNITPCLVLFFKTEPYIKPIRGHRFAEYRTFLELGDANPKPPARTKQKLKHLL